MLVTSLKKKQARLIPIFLILTIFQLQTYPGQKRLALGEKDKFIGIFGIEFYLNWQQFRNLIDYFVVVDKSTDNAALVNVSRKVSPTERIHNILGTDDEYRCRGKRRDHVKPLSIC